MNDALITNQAAAEAEDAVEAEEVETAEVSEEETAAAESETSVDDIKKVYFPSESIADAQTEVGKVANIADEHNLDMVFNFDTEKEFPDGYGIAIVPIAKRDKAAKENIVIGVAVAAIPDVATVAKHDNGQQFINDSVTGNMIAKLANAVRPRGDSGEAAASIPFTVEDFITSNRQEGVLLAYRSYASSYVKVLKKKGLKFLTESILRQCLQSAAFAEQQFPSIGQDKWVAIIDSMIARAESDGVAVGMLADWKETRDSATLQDRDVDLSDLDFDEI